MGYIESNRRVSSGRGIPPKYLYRFTKIREWVESGIGASSWMDTTGTVALSEGWVYTAVPGEYLLSSDRSWEWMPVTSSYFAFGIRFQLPDGFTPLQRDQWYWCNPIIGQSIDGVQRDCAVVLSRNGYISLGYSTSSVMEGTVSALDGQVHDVILVVLPKMIYVVVDGKIDIKMGIEMSGTQMTKIGLLNNQENAEFNTRGGKVYRAAYWSYVEPTNDIIEESLPTL